MPISRKDSFTIQLLQIIDAVLVLISFWIGGGVRQLIHYVFGWSSITDNEYLSMTWVLLIAVPFVPLALERFGFYIKILGKKKRTAINQLLRGITLVILLVAVVAVFGKVVDSRRLILAVGFIFVFLLLFIRDRLTIVWLKRRSSSQANKERVVIAGTGKEMDELLAELEPEAVADWNIVSHFDLSTQTVDELYSLLKQESVSRVVFSAKNTSFEEVSQAVNACELQGVEAWIAASFVRGQIARPVFDAVGSKPMLVMRSTPELSLELLCKGIMDRVIASIVILCASPLLVIAAVGIRLTSPGAPVFFTQMRAGRYGNPFKMWKFRTMVANAEQLLEKTKEEHGNQMDGPVFKLDQDPRIFPFGAMLRKLSIDELPQLFNVLTGEMSLVGPRPLPLYEVAAFRELSHRRRLSVKPGITCEWQAGGRNKITNFNEWVEMDLRYIDNWSLGLDIQILFKTIPAVLFAKGAK